MFPLATAILLGIGLAGFIYTAYNRWILLGMAKPVARSNNIAHRVWNMALYAVGQKKFFLHGQVSGLMHAFIFWGFCVVALRTVILFGQGFSADFAGWFLNSWAGHIYNIFRDFFEVLVCIGCVALLFRRLFLKTPRLTLSLEANVILCTILSLMITDFMMEANTWFTFAYFAHLVLILGFLNWLPYGKHFHIITSLPNVFLGKLEPAGAITPLNLEDETATEFGVGKITDFNWKQFLDLYSCTECGRCQDQCPAFATDKPLSPKELTIALRDHLYDRAPGLKTSWTIPADGKTPHPAPSPLGGEGGGEGGLPPLIENVIKADAIWACTTCRACEEACPVMIEYVDKIVDLRRNQVLMQGALSPEAQTALQNIEKNSNPWGIGYSTRGDWANGLGVKTLAEDKNVEYLYFVGCAGSFDERAKKVSKAFVKLLQKAQVSFGMLGAEEKCTGDSARRIGNEYLFQLLAKDNIATFEKYGVKKIITTCPHCYNTLKNEYPQFGGKYEVHHHTEFLLGLVKKGRFHPLPHPPPSRGRAGERGQVTYHDSCYLGRYNDIYNAPRELLKMAVYTICEPKETKDTGRCCGAGGGRMWMEEKLGTRINHKRLEDLQKTGTNKVAAACPFCLTMLTDATREKKVDNIEVLDVAEILLESFRA